MEHPGATQNTIKWILSAGEFKLCYQCFHTFILLVISSSVLGIWSRLNLLIQFAVLTEKIILSEFFLVLFLCSLPPPIFDWQNVTKGLTVVRPLNCCENMRYFKSHRQNLYILYLTSRGKSSLITR